MSFLKFEVNNLLKKGVTQYQEGTLFEMTDLGAILFCYYSNPTPEEIEDFNHGQVQYGYFKNKNVIIMLFKFEDNPWIDAPYSVHLSKNLIELNRINEGNGLSITVILVDADTGIVKNIRAFALSNRFSNKLIEDIKIQKNMSFNGFNSNLNMIYSSYSARELMNRAEITDILK